MTVVEIPMRYPEHFQVNTFSGLVAYLLSVLILFQPKDGKIALNYQYQLVCIFPIHLGKLGENFLKMLLENANHINHFIYYLISTVCQGAINFNGFYIQVPYPIIKDVIYPVSKFE